MKSTKILSIIFAVAIFLTSAVYIVPTTRVAAAESEATEYDWNIAHLDFSKFSNASALPANLKPSWSHANECTHTDRPHLTIENNELGYSPSFKGHIGAVNYILDETIESGKVVISTKYQVFKPSNYGNAFSLYIHATSPEAANANYNQGTIHTRLLILSVNPDTGAFFLQGPGNQQIPVLEDLVFTTDAANRQEMTIVVDLDKGTVDFETAGKKDSVTLAELGHNENNDLKKVCAVGFGLGFLTGSMGIGTEKTRGYISYLKISDGTPMSEHVHKGTAVSEVPASCGVEGTKAFYTCSCGKVFEDAECTKEITNLDEWKVIPALSHADGDNDGICDNCGDRMGEDTTEGTDNDEGTVTTNNGEDSATETVDGEESKNSGYIYIICAAAVVVLAVVLFFVFKKKGNK